MMASFRKQWIYGTNIWYGIYGMKVWIYAHTIKLTESLCCVSLFSATGGKQQLVIMVFFNYSEYAKPLLSQTAGHVG